MAFQDTTTAQLPSSILEKAAEVISKPGSWVQGVFQQGDFCFCARGAISVSAGAPHLSYGDPLSEDYLFEAVMGARPKSPLTSASGAAIVIWNDKVGRTQTEIIEAFRKAAAIARERGE